MTRDTLAAILAARDSGRTPVWITPIEDAGGTESVLYPLETDVGVTQTPEMDAALAAATSDRAIEFEHNGIRQFARPFNPPPKLVLVGAVHIAQALVPMAVLAGLNVVVVDPRPDWISEFRFPEAQLIRAWPGEAFASLDLDHRTAIVTLTHDPKVDDPALLAALAAPVFYVGALGSRRTHTKRAERLAASGEPRASIDRIRSPVGLDIGAVSPSEIAVSILAQVIQVLRG